MHWIGANLFLLLIVLTVAGYGWLALWLLRVTGLYQYGLIGIPAAVAVLVATYFTMKYVHAVIQKRL